MTADLVTRLRTACSPESPLGKLCSEAANELQLYESEAVRLRDYVNEDKADADKWRNLACVDGPLNSFELWKDRAESAEASLKEAVELLKPFAQIAAMEKRSGAMDSVMVNVARCRDAQQFLEAHTGGDDENHG